MKRISWQVLLGISLVMLSALLYFLHYVVFKDVHHIFIYLLGDIAFVPIEVLLVTLIIHKYLSGREKRILLEKLNMLIGAFYSEIGTELLTYFSDADPELERTRKELIIKSNWSDKEFSHLADKLKSFSYNTDISKINLSELKGFLIVKRDFMMRLLENQNLLEHEAFTDLLWAAFHLTEELSSRDSLESLPKTDYQHLSGDIKRVYGLIVKQWLDYMKHLKKHYPYLFSLAIRTNPFDKNASPLVVG